MKKLFLFIIAAMLLVPAWAKRHKHRNNQTNVSKVLSVTVTHTGCYGRCPCYSITVAPDGTITYTGIKFVEDTGKYVKKREATVAKPILDEVALYRLDTCKRLYNSTVQDLPGLQYSIAYTDSTKVIMVGAYSGPGYFRKLAREIEPLGKKTDTVGWRKISY